MTFKNFEELLKTKYPEAEAVPHGKFGGTEKTGKVEINFKPNGKAYTYYGSYIQILNKVGIKCISRSYYKYIENQLEQAKEEHGKPDPFFEGELMDNSEEIKRLENLLDNYDFEYIIIED